MRPPPPQQRGAAGPDDPGEVAARSRALPDLRTLLLGAGAWGGALVGRAAPGPVVVVVVLVAGAPFVVWAGRVLRERGGRDVPGVATTLAGLGLVVAAVSGGAFLRVAAVADGPVPALAVDGAVVDLTLRVVSDPRLVHGQFGDLVALRVQSRRISGRGRDLSVAVPLLVLGDPVWRAVELGSTVTTTGRLAAADDDDLAALVVSPDAPVEIEAPGPAWRAAGRLRAAIREAVSGRPPVQRVLVPALVDGDDAGLDPAVAEQFRVTGLTHLTAVSGTNLTLLVGFLVVLARGVGVRGRWLTAVGAVGVIGFVLLARTEPSVLRAAVMGSVGLVALGLNGRDRAARALGVAVVVLLLATPSLAGSPGFALSVLATGGIVLLGPGLRDALASWTPRVVAEAVAVPIAAQLACTPVVAAISGQVSLVAVAANLLVGAVVGPATVLGLLGGAVGLLWPWWGQVVATPAAWCVGWIALVADKGAALPLPALTWGTSAVAIAALTVLTVAVGIGGLWVLRRRWLSVLACLVLVTVVLARLPSPGWPPAGWVMVMCDVGQGDGLVLRAGTHEAVVVDVGPDPTLIGRCLDRLGVTSVPLLVLTHFHADHVDGLSGVGERRVGEVLTTRVLDPPSGVEEVLTTARESTALPGPDLAPWGRTITAGDVTVQVLWPTPGPAGPGAGDGSSANDASVVLLAEVDEVRILLTGDVEPPAQAALAASLPPLDVDVLKVPHHGSRYQDQEWLAALDAEIALVSVGEGNDYGHPATGTLETLTRSGAEVHRTDLEGDLAVVTDGSAIAVRTR